MSLMMGQSLLCYNTEMSLNMREREREVTWSQLV